MAYIIIPKYAKSAAKRGLNQRKRFEGKKPGLTPEQASKLGIQSGVQRAYSLQKQKYITTEEAKEVARFWSRFRNCETNRCKIAIDLWGGRRWGSELYNRFYR